MANPLQAMLAKAKEKQDESVRDRNEGTPTTAAGDSPSVEQPANVQAKAAAPATPTGSHRNPFGGGGIKPPVDSSDKQRADGDKPAPTSESAGSDRPKLAGLKLPSSSPAIKLPSGDAKQVAAPVSLSLESLSESESEGIAPVSSGFVDETPADKPTRELPEGVTKEELNFLETVDSIYNILHDPELLGGVVRNILIELKSHPEYMKLVAPEDVRQWVRGMRESMGLARIKKTEAKAKRSGGAGRKSGLVDNDMLADLDAIAGGTLLD